MRVLGGISLCCAVCLFVVLVVAVRLVLCVCAALSCLPCLHSTSPPLISRLSLYHGKPSHHIIIISYTPRISPHARHTPRLLSHPIFAQLTPSYSRSCPREATPCPPPASSHLLQAVRPSVCLRHSVWFATRAPLSSSNLFPPSPLSPLMPSHNDHHRTRPESRHLHIAHHSRLLLLTRGRVHRHCVFYL